RQAGAVPLAGSVDAGAGRDERAHGACVGRVDDDGRRQVRLLVGADAELLEGREGGGAGGDTVRGLGDLVDDARARVETDPRLDVALLPECRVEPDGCLLI